jgi:hypothetical protein
MRTPLQIAIENARLTDKELATILRLPIPTITSWREGHNSPHEFMLPGILKLLGGTHSMDTRGFIWSGDYFDYETAQQALAELEKKLKSG